MESHLQQIIEVQAEQNQLLRNQLRWMAVGLLIMAAVSICSMGVLVHEHGKVAVTTTEPIIQHPLSLAENDAIQFQFTAKSFVENDPSQLATGNRLTVPPMATTAPIELNFSAVVNDTELRPGRGCDGMCM